MKAIFLNGRQGSGKGLQGGLLSQLGFKHLIASDALEAVQAQNPAYKHEVTGYVSAGILVPDQITLKALTGYLEEKTTPADNLVLDGYMRTSGQADGMIRYLEEMGYQIIVVFLVLPVEKAIKRALDRGRPDDTPDKLAVRFKGYDEHVGSVLATVVHRGHSISVVDTSGDPESIHDSICSLAGVKTRALVSV